MNGTADSVSFPNKLSSSRPPAVGEEVKVFRDISYRPSDHQKKMEDFQSTCEGDKTDLFTDDDTTESETLKYEDPFQTSNPSPPAAFKWAQSLQCLLSDVKGVDLFEHFLNQEGHDTKSLAFYFACRGVKKTDASDKDRLFRLIFALYDKKMRRINVISPQTKEDIRLKLVDRAVDVNIFDDAQKEIEQYMLYTTYPNFLSSDIYLEYLRSVQNEQLQERKSHGTAEPYELPTVHEDLELSLNKTQNFKESFLSRKKYPSYKIKPDSQAASYSKSPYSTYSSYHTKYASFLPASAQDSELQSLSSDAQTDDTMSLTDSSIDFPMHCRPKQKRTPKTKYGGVLNKDTKLNVNNFIPRSMRPVNEAMTMMATKEPAKFHAVLIEKLQRLEEEQKTKEKFNERYHAIEGPQTQSFHPLQLQPAEDNVQDILDAHVSRVFKDTGLTPTLSPICNSPPAMKAIGEDTLRIPSSGQNDHTQDLLNNYSQKAGQQLPPFAVPYAMRYSRRDVDARSSDSGALTDWTSEDNLQSLQRPLDYASSSETLEYSQIKRNRDHQLKRYISKKNQADSASSCVDSGISVACEPLPIQSSCHSKVSSWLESKKGASEMEKDHQWKNPSSTSPVLSRSSSSRKAVSYNSTRSGGLDPGNIHWPLVPAQPVAQDLSMPALPVPDTTTNLLEARRRLEDESRTKPGKSKHNSGGRNSHEVSKLRNSFRACNLVDESNLHSSRKQNKKSQPSTFLESASSPVGCSDTTIIGYSYGRDAVPYKSRFPGKNITLRQFKSLLSKKGNFKYWFKRVSDEFGTGVVLEEVSDDSEILPLWEGKVFCVIESVDEAVINED